ncbi:PssE/Cps14G family polysaccharide biosynthesis glycosyltransferase [Thiothrix nivea]|uniref:Glycosyltransferase 28 domain-containing protein n=1 Tax=Thiothrix nivea (strain ATCC 35100 / DSM 5205 / JP2) TaxID=870187 RepID=A0A656HG63_THINJ|nr:PssE/Cps14G family polysaccharide biosynthesis glycosyltransferase [Thiothrix nivea]EIJ34380.1 Glycosyltransferase 28 domain-containing protein [Thiothrix nivea DSM 5205]
MLNSQGVYNKKRILVITGTTGFDSLVKSIDAARELENDYEIVLQTGEGKYLPCHKKYFAFDADLKQKLGDYDYFVTHAGAGTIFMLLEYRKPVLVVPNTERADKHQTELAGYVGSNSLCAVCDKVEHVADSIQNIAQLTANLRPYAKVEFFAARDILDYIYHG